MSKHETREMVPVGPLTGGVRPPGSKSITNRALVCAALAEGRSTLSGVLDSDDTRVMVDALGKLGFEVQVDRERQQFGVVGSGGRIPAATADLFVGNSGTTIRFLTAAVALGYGTYELRGTPRMHERPIADLADTMTTLGASIRWLEKPGCPPLVVEATGLEGGTATVRGDISSQFLSGLLLAAPYARKTVVLNVDGPLVSRPYVHMTLAVMQSFGVQVETDPQLTHFRVPCGVGYQGRDYAIEPDASAASYFFAAAAITGGTVTVEGLSADSLQGDVAFVDVLERMGCRVEPGRQTISVAGRHLHGIEVDMNAISDTVQTLAAVALFAEGPTTIRGVGHIRHKETDRIGALATELRKLGAEVEERPDGLRITPRKLYGATIDTYDDHRMAMSLALVGLRVPRVVIRDPGCTSKTYPDFFRDLDRLAGRSA